MVRSSNNGIPANGEHPNSLRSKRESHIRHVLDETGYDLERTAETLQISMSELKRWMTKLRIYPPAPVRKPDTGAEGRGPED